MFPFSSANPFPSGVPEPVQPVADQQQPSLLMEVDGMEFFVPAIEDEESATFADEEGMSILADTDGDGRIDYVSNVTFDGQWSAWRWGFSQDGGDNPLDNPPEYGDQSWNAQKWTCVERGEWG